MANNILTIADGDYGYPTSTIATLVQGQYGQSLPLEIRDLAGNVVSLTDFSTLSAIKSSERGRVTSIVGTITLSGTPTVAPQLSWMLDEADTGIAGTFSLVLSISNGTITHETHPVELVILPNPAVNAVAAPGVVGITTAQRTLLAAIQGLTGLVKMAAGTATGIAVQSFMETFLASATAVAARLNLLPSYTGNTGKVLAVNGAETDVEWVAQSGGGAVDSVFGRTGAVIAASGDYDATEVSYDSGVPGVWETVALALAGIDSNNNATVIDLDAHIDATTNVHGIADTSLLLDTSDIGATVQAYSAKTAAIAGLTWAANSIIMLTGTATASVQALAAHVITFLQSASAADARAAIGAGDTIEYIIVPLSDETTALTAGAAKQTFVMPYAMTLTGVIANVNTAPTGSALQVDINEGLSSILSTKLTIDATEKTSATAATPAVISDSALASGAEIIFDLDAVGSVVAGAGLKVTLIGTR